MFIKTNQISSAGTANMRTLLSESVCETFHNPVGRLCTLSTVSKRDMCRAVVEAIGELPSCYKKDHEFYLNPFVL